MRRVLSGVDVIALGLFVLALVPFGALLHAMRREAVLALALFTAALFAYVVWSLYVVRRRPEYGNLFSIDRLALVLLGCGAAVVLLGWIPLTAVAHVHLVALVLILLYYWLVVSLAVYHYQHNRAQHEPSPPYDSISVLVPAYNEEGYIRPTIRALLDADYPEERTEIIVVDDGSTDNTYREALRFREDGVKVVRKENGGKHSALNYGLLFATGDVIVTIDADSIVDERALKRIVAPFQADPGVGAVASNVRIENDGTFLTRCQKLEYLIGINVYRRMLDVLGVVTIVPGCLGAFRREAIEDVSGYDPTTLTEDFDLTMKVIKAGWKVRMSDARVYTEAPETWRDLYNQRLRWYRGNYMTVFKHWDAGIDPGYGALHRFAFPIHLVDMFVIPFASWVIAGVIAYRLLAGPATAVLALFALFTSLVLLVAALAIHIEGDDWRLALYAPLFVVGYKHFHDAVAVKSLVDVVSGRKMAWTRAKRVDRPRPAASVGTE